MYIGLDGCILVMKVLPFFLLNRGVDVYKSLFNRIDLPFRFAKIGFYCSGSAATIQYVKILRSLEL